MEEDNKIPIMVLGLIVVIFIAVLLFPPELLDIRPDREDPVADAGPDMTITLGEYAILNGSGSSDDKGISSFQWMIEQGNQTFFYRGPQVSFLFDAPGEYRAVLTVTDVADKESIDELRITVVG